MNPLEQRIAIAESVGWTVYHRNDKGEIKSWKSPDGSIWQEPWTPLRFTEDLNAMHEVERGLDDDLGCKYVNNLAEIVRPEWRDSDDMFYKSSTWTLRVVIATAAQRAEAYLRTINKWKD